MTYIFQGMRNLVEIGLPNRDWIFGGSRVRIVPEGLSRAAATFADILEIPAWRGGDPLACLLLAAYAAIIAYPLVHGNLVATLMRVVPVR